MVELWIHVREAFERYGSSHFCAKNVADARQFEVLYNTVGAHKISVVAEDADASDDRGSDYSSDDGFSSDDDSSSEDEDGY